MLPPMLQISYDDGSGGYHSPYSATVFFTSALSSPGWHTAVRVTGSTSMARIFSADLIRRRVGRVPQPILGDGLFHLGVEQSGLAHRGAGDRVDVDGAHFLGRSHTTTGRAGTTAHTRRRSFSPRR